MSEKIIDKKRMESGTMYIMIGFFYTAMPVGSLLLNRMISTFFNVSNLTLYSSSIGNLIVGIVIIANGFILIRRTPIQNKLRLGQLAIVFSSTMFVCGILTLIGLNYDSEYLIINIIAGVLILPVFISGIVFLSKGIYIMKNSQQRGKDSL